MDCLRSSDRLICLGECYHVFSGFNFDLRKLTKTDGNYLIVSNSTSHNYYINVCETASNTPCANDTAWHIGVCQIDRNK